MQTDRSTWPDMQKRMAAIFRQKTRAEWVSIMQDTDICFAPVLKMSEAIEHEHNRQRDSFPVIDGIVQPGPAHDFRERRPRCSAHRSGSARTAMRSYANGDSPGRRDRGAPWRSGAVGQVGSLSRMRS